MWWFEHIIKFLGVFVNVGVFICNWDEGIYVTVLPFERELFKFKGASDVNKFGSKTANKIIVYGFIGDGHVILFEVAFDLQCSCSI